MVLFLDPNGNTFRQSAYFGGGAMGSNHGAPIFGSNYDPGKNSERPDTPREAWVRMREAAALPDDLIGGNRRMRENSMMWLPREERESHSHYSIRVNRSTCFPLYRDAVTSLSSKPFARPVMIDGLSEGYSEFLRDVDGTGKSITVFCRDLMRDAIHRGMAHVLVDAASPEDSLRGQMDRRAFAKIIDPLRVLDIGDEMGPDGRVVVTYVRMIVPRTVKEGEFGSKTVNTICELRRPLDGEGSKSMWNYNEKSNEWVKGETVAYNPGGVGIPFYTFYTNQTGEYEAEPALEDLAYVNLAHFQSRADHAHVMRVARLITLVLTGWKQGGIRDPQTKGSQEITLGPLSKIQNSDPQAKASFLEPSGRSIELSFQDMEALQKEAQRLGARHLSSGKSHVTAQSVMLDQARLSNDLYSFCIRMESELENIFRAVGEWLNLPADNVRPLIWKDWDASTDMDGASKALASMGDVVSPRQKLLEAVRHGILRPDFPIEENLSEIEEMQEVMRDAFGEGVEIDDETEDKVVPESDSE